MKPKKRQLLSWGLLLSVMLLKPALAPAQAEKIADGEALRAGKNFLATAVHTEAEDQRLLSLYKGLRVADVTDGMDAVGLQDIGLMDPEIHALWRDTEHFSHRFAGVAVTARYVPTQDPPAGKMTVAAYDEWAGNWYDKRSTEAYLDLVRKGTALVIEDGRRTPMSAASAPTTSWSGSSTAASAS